MSGYLGGHFNVPRRPIHAMSSVLKTYRYRIHNVAERLPVPNLGVQNMDYKGNNVFCDRSR